MLCRVTCLSMFAGVYTDAYRSEGMTLRHKPRVAGFWAIHMRNLFLGHLWLITHYDRDSARGRIAATYAWSERFTLLHLHELQQRLFFIRFILRVSDGLPLPLFSDAGHK